MKKLNIKKKILFNIIMIINIFIIPNYTLAQNINGKQYNPEFIATIVIISLLEILLIIFLTIKLIKKFKKKTKNENTKNVKRDIDYYRELIKENDLTPSEVVQLVKENFDSIELENVFMSAILDLKLKNKIEIIQEENTSDDCKTKIRILDLNKKPYLLEDEKNVLQFLKKATKSEYITLEDLKYYIVEHQEEVKNLRDCLIKESKKRILEKGLFNLDNYKKRETNYFYLILWSIFFLSTIMIILVCLANPITYILTILTLVIDIQVGIILFDRVKKYNNVLTEKGRKEKEKWLGFKKYVENYSILDERKAEEVELWDNYMVYATALGVTKNIREQFKMAYPDLEEFIVFLKSDETWKGREK